MVTVVTTYACDICKEQHATEAEAHACEAKGVLDMKGGPYQPGQLILCGGQGWWEGDPEWREPGTPEDPAYIHGAIGFHSKWVIIDRRNDPERGHMIRYTLWTPSARWGKPTVATTSPWHYHVKRVVGEVTPEELAKHRADAAAWLKAEKLSIAGHRLPLVG